MKEIKKLYSNNWIELREMIYPEKGISGYTYLHEKRCNGKIVSLLPFRYSGFHGSRNSLEYLLRSEVTPCWHSTKEFTSSITGGVEENILETAVHELKEEAGYSVDKSDLIYLGTCRGTKSSDTIYYLFTVDLTNFEQGVATTDGSELEKKAHCYWSSSISNAKDPMVYVSYYKIIQLLNENKIR